ncbi:hypothetical protein BDQ17DRAFT_129416 [Cyathus striatus]|nr:hypothetical protein BDQ17DRAFT_129416 [Cyathus striatus]
MPAVLNKSINHYIGYASSSLCHNPSMLMKWTARALRNVTLHSSTFDELSTTRCCQGSWLILSDSYPLSSYVFSISFRLLETGGDYRHPVNYASICCLRRPPLRRLSPSLSSSTCSPGPLSPRRHPLSPFALLPRPHPSRCRCRPASSRARNFYTENEIEHNTVADKNNQTLHYEAVLVSLIL